MVLGLTFLVVKVNSCPPPPPDHAVCKGSGFGRPEQCPSLPCELRSQLWLVLGCVVAKCTAAPGMVGGGAAAKWFLKKGKNDGKSSGILWESATATAAAAIAGNVFLECQSVPTAHPDPRRATATWGGAKDPYRVREAAFLPTPFQLSLQLTIASELPGICCVWAVPASSW